MSKGGRMHFRMVAAAVLLLAPAAAAPGEPELWAGHEIVLGEVNIPLLGKIQSRTESLLLTQVIRGADGIHLVERPCEVKVTPVLGSSATMSQATVRRLPPAQPLFVRRGNWMVAPPFHSGWGSEDVDEDGHPGATVNVDVPICGGQVYVTSDSVTVARGFEEAGGLRGQLKVKAHQVVLGTSGGCLSIFAVERREDLHGTFAFVPVPPDSTCESLAPSWPVVAAE